MWSVFWTVAAVYALAASPSAVAAQPGGAVSGRVADAAARPLPGVTVEVREGAATRSTSSDGEGVYRLEGLPEGVYEVSFRLPGFATTVVRQVEIVGGRTTAVDTTLNVALTTQVVVAAARTFRDLSTVESADDVIGIASAASNGVIAPSQLQNRSLQRPADLMERVPGVVISQHSGEGKANQYYVRGFNVDHGTDLALSVAGVPVNFPTHGHGQGWADVNFLIPELVGGIQYRKGPYYADEGDFSAAGAVHIAYLALLDRPLAKVELGEDGYLRGLFAQSRPLGGGHLLYSVEYRQSDGPWENPDDYRKLNGVLRYSRAATRGAFSVTALGYDGRWNATDQVPARAVRDGRVSRFGTVDATDGGRSHRYSLSLDAQRSREGATSRLSAYAVDYRLNLFSNFTYFFDDPVSGDQFEQADRRRVFGGHLAHQWLSRWRGRPVESRVGIQGRYDDVGSVALYRTKARTRLGTVRADAVGQASGAAYVETTVQWAEKLRTAFGLRGDVYRFDVDSDNPANSGTHTASLLSPKLSVALGPWSRTEVYVNAGFGFHSNDGRGATITVDPRTGEPVARVDPLVRARGAEVGVRTLAPRNVHATLALWALDIDSELVFVGDAGTTEAGRPSRRIGFEWATDWSPLPWLKVDASLAYSRARFRDRDSAGDRIPGAIDGVAAAGVGVNTDRWLGSARLRWFGGRPLIEDGSVRSRASCLVTAQLGYEVDDRWSVKLDVFNVFDAEVSDVDYFYTSRLPGEPAEGFGDIHTHPVEPRSFRLGIALSF